MATMIDRIKKAAAKVHPDCVVEVCEWSDGRSIEILLPEDAGLRWLSGEGTVLIIGSHFFDSWRETLQAALDEVRLGTYKDR